MRGPDWALKIDSCDFLCTALPEPTGNDGISDIELPTARAGKAELKDIEVEGGRGGQRFDRREIDSIDLGPRRRFLRVPGGRTLSPKERAKEREGEETASVTVKP
eukprot:1563386-Pyramimonas_sp.AAC.1